MRARLIYTIVSLVALSQVAPAQSNPEISYSTPPNWIQITPDGSYPVRLINELWEGEIDVFRSDLAAHEMILDDKGMKRSVRDVIDNFVMDFPRALLLSNTGYNEEHRLRFEVEFISADTAADRTIQHRLVGLIYRHPEDHQILFTLWGRTPVEHYDMVGDDIKMFESDFRYIGQAANTVFPTSGNVNWMAPISALLLLGVLYMMRRRHSKLSKIEFAEQQNFWRCTCGRLNHVDLSDCRRCGNARSSTTSSE